MSKQGSSYPPHVWFGMGRGHVVMAECLALVPCVLAALLYGSPLRMVMLWAVVLAAAGLVEAVCAVAGKRRGEPRCLFHGLLFGVMLSPQVALWQAAAAMAIGTVVSQKRLGGARLNCLHPALTAYVVLQVLFSGPIEGAVLWGWANAGASVLGALWLMFAGIRNRRLAAAVLIGVLGGVIPLSVFLGFGAWGSVAGGICFGALFLMADPYVAPFTTVAQWIFGIAAGALMALVAAAPEWFFLILLLCNAVAPVLDDLAVEWHIQELKKPPQRSLV